MDANSALRIVDGGSESEGDHVGEIPVYDFFVNVDNIFLKTEQKAAPQKADILKARFKYGMVLIGLGIVRHSYLDNEHHASEDHADEDSPSDLIARTTDGLAPMLLPMIDALGGELDLEAGTDFSDEFGDGDEA